jgi:prevent-host-death family protein
LVLLRVDDVPFPAIFFQNSSSGIEHGVTAPAITRKEEPLRPIGTSKSATWTATARTLPVQFDLGPPGVQHRANFGKLLRRVEDERRSLVIEKRGTPKAVLLSIPDYVRLAAPEPEVMRVSGEESRRKGTDKLTSRQIDQIIKTARAQRPKRG